MNEELKSIVYSKNSLEFLTVAKEYCAFAEAPSKYDRHGFVDKSLKLLSILYLKALMLPKVELIHDEGNERFVTEYDWQFVKKGIENIMGDHDVYLDFFDDEMNETPEPVTSSVSENMADVYQDLKDFLQIYQLAIPDLMNDALYECSQSFESYWGSRVVNTLRVLHRVLFKFGAADNDNEIDNIEKHKTSDWFISRAQKGFRSNDE
jgi:hypothetical protein